MSGPRGRPAALSRWCSALCAHFEQKSTHSQLQRRRPAWPTANSPKSEALGSLLTLTSCSCTEIPTTEHSKVCSFAWLETRGGFPLESGVVLYTLGTKHNYTSIPPQECWLRSIIKNNPYSHPRPSSKPHRTGTVMKTDCYRNILTFWETCRPSVPTITFQTSSSSTQAS